MTKYREEKTIITEHILEVRHGASGTLLDIRGSVADYIRKEGLFPHWRMTSDVVNFTDKPDSMKLEGAFVGYKSAGYIVLNPSTRNYYSDRASAFWKKLLTAPNYTMPEPIRFGARTKFFFPSTESFESINERMYETFFTETARDLIGGRETDLQFTINLKEENFRIKVLGGPIKKNEARRYFQFEQETFTQNGLFIDIDCYKTNNLTLNDVPGYLKKSNELSWSRAERIAAGLGI